MTHDTPMYISKIHDNTNIYMDDWENLKQKLEKIKPNDAVMISPFLDSENLTGEVFSILVSENEMYVCFLYNGEEFYVINPSCTIDEEWDVYMGHWTVLPAKYFIKKEDAFEITKTYFESRSMNENYKWEIK